MHTQAEFSVAFFHLSGKRSSSGSHTVKPEQPVVIVLLGNCLEMQEFMGKVLHARKLDLYVKYHYMSFFTLGFTN